MDHMQMAKEMYLQQAKGHFKSEAAWEILHHHPKWSGIGIDSSSASSSISTTTSSSAGPSNGTYRPEGSKAAKRWRLTSISTSDSAQDANAQDRISILKHANELNIQQNLLNKQQHVLALRQQELAEKTMAMEHKKIDLVRKTTNATVSQANLAIIMQSEDLCPDDKSKEMLRLLKQTVKSQLCPLNSNI